MSMHKFGAKTQLRMALTQTLASHMSAVHLRGDSFIQFTTHHKPTLLGHCFSMRKPRGGLLVCFACVNVVSCSTL